MNSMNNMIQYFVNGSNPQATNIKEANDHMRAMHQRIVDLEQRVKEQSELLDRREHEHSCQIEEQNIQHQKQLSMHNHEISGLEQRLAKLEDQKWERDCQVAHLLRRCSYLDEAASYAPHLEHLATVLKSAFIPQSQPQMVSVKPTRILPNGSATPIQNKVSTIKNSDRTQYREADGSKSNTMVTATTPSRLINSNPQIKDTNRN